MTYRKKLIEVALPLDAINREASREKSIRHGHPSTLHLWWSRKPLAACRAVLFASLVDDPSSRPDEFPTEDDQQRERKRLFKLIEELVKWENLNNEPILGEARKEILKSTNGNPPPVLDPFCGGGSIPLEAQRLGLEAYASDLNPIAVLITKAMIEIPPRFAGLPPVNPADRDTLVESQSWKGAAGLAADVRYYGKWIRNEAEKRIGHLYPKVTLPKKHGGGKSKVIAWLWARTVKCPNPACGAKIPLMSKFWLSTKKGNQAWVEPIVDRVQNIVWFEVKTGSPDNSLVAKLAYGTSFVNERGKKVRATFKCVVCDVGVAKGDYINTEANAKRMGITPLAIVARANRKRAYLPFDDTHKTVLTEAEKYFLTSNVVGKIPTEPARGTFASNAQGRVYGFKTFADYFTCRQLIGLTTFSDLVSETRRMVETDVVEGRRDAEAYVDAVMTYLGFAADRLLNRASTVCIWNTTAEEIEQAFPRQGISMSWDFAESNVFSDSTGGWSGSLEWIPKVLESLPARSSAKAEKLDASVQLMASSSPLISTDPPYYDNVGYADLSDYFYIWLRRSLREIYPDLFSLMLVPKTRELVANRYRFGGDKSKAEAHFLKGLNEAFHLMRSRAHPNYPMTVFYAFKQTEKDGKSGGNASTGWETMLEGLLSAGFQITGTLPMRTERPTGMKVRTNTLASSIVLICRPRPDDLSTTARRDFIVSLRRELPEALKHLQKGNIAPVDLAQAAIGPGMAVFSRFSNVLEADGNPMRIRTALQIINAELDSYFAEQEGDLDADTRFCSAWFEQHGMGEGAYGDADVLARAKNSSVEGVAESGTLHARAGKVRLLNRDEYPAEWDPISDSRINTWKCTQYLIHALERGGETEAGRLVNLLGGGASEAARALAYRLYAICDHKSWVQEAVDYNTLVTSWTHIQAVAASRSDGEERPGDLF